MLNEASKLINEFPQLAELFYKDMQKEAFGKLSQMMPDINRVMASFISAIPSYNEQGAGIPIDVVVTQLNNLMEALKNKDTIMLADCIQYELTESISIYKEILEDLEGK